MNEKTAIKRLDRIGQVIDFRSLRFGGDTTMPTDLDGFIDFGNKAFVFIELKYNDADMPVGQSLALERLCDAVSKSGIKTMVIKASHLSNIDEAIDCGNCLVSKLRINGQWRPIIKKVSVRKVIEWFLTECGLADKYGIN